MLLLQRIFCLVVEVPAVETMWYFPSLLAFRALAFTFRQCGHILATKIGYISYIETYISANLIIRRRSGRRGRRQSDTYRLGLYLAHRSLMLIIYPTILPSSNLLS